MPKHPGLEIFRESRVTQSPTNLGKLLKNNCQVAKRTVADNGARWEYSHLLHFMLPFCAFVSSVVAALMHAQQA